MIDLEVEAGTPSPTVDPSVRTILIGHSMGGIVAAETVIGLTSEQPIYSEDGVEKGEDAASHAVSSLMFPYVQGVLAFDTPFLGISPGVVAHGAEGHYQTASAVVSQLGGLASLWGAGKAASKSSTPKAALPSASSTGDEKQKKKQGNEGGDAWGKWGKVAVAAGAAGAVAAGGAAAWMNRAQITEGWGWASSHLEFVGCLARAEELKKRVECIVHLGDEAGVGFANLYTRLGRDAPSREAAAVAGMVLGPDRTFCNLPKRLAAGEWKAAVNDKAKDETVAHMSEFPNPPSLPLSHITLGPCVSVRLSFGGS